MRIAIVGATGLVGRKMIEVLGERGFSNCDFVAFASARSANSTVDICNKKYTVVELTHQNISKHKVDIALFSAGGQTSLDFAPCFVENGAVVIDNSSAFRMDKNVPLVVPEVNPQDAFKHKGIIANPNCSTIQAVVALKPLHDKYKLKRVVYSTYQAVSGAGVAGVTDLQDGINGNPPKKFVHQIAFNCLPHIDSFLDDGYTKEEHKMINETRKIFDNQSIKITATCVRVPVKNSHSESINAEFELPCTLEGVKTALSGAKGVVLLNDTSSNVYPMPVTADGKDDVFVGRVRIDNSVESGVNIWVVSDNLRKGAATNAVQIAQLLINNK